ncbi:hypothetical protein SAY87_029319 [Trapa incisa]|uniref:Uncharacterized protein n=1 Tax=Trapa incisa TaxID=236973 RepID=A0AAN7QCZ8_9MYRT|nr:hypothetical protein SAY87_029319 [Trapa incisa]
MSVSGDVDCGICSSVFGKLPFNDIYEYFIWTLMVNENVVEIKYVAILVAERLRSGSLFGHGGDNSRTRRSKLLQFQASKSSSRIVPLSDQMNNSFASYASGHSIIGVHPHPGEA